MCNVMLIFPLTKCRTSLFVRHYYYNILWMKNINFYNKLCIYHQKVLGTAKTESLSCPSVFAFNRLLLLIICCFLGCIFYPFKHAFLILSMVFLSISFFPISCLFPIICINTIGFAIPCCLLPGLAQDSRNRTIQFYAAGAFLVEQPPRHEPQPSARANLPESTHSQQLGFGIWPKEQQGLRWNHAGSTHRALFRRQILLR